MLSHPLWLTPSNSQRLFDFKWRPPWAGLSLNCLVMFCLLLEETLYIELGNPNRTGLSSRRWELTLEWTYPAINTGGGSNLGHTPSTAGTFRKKFRKNSGKTPATLSARFLEFPRIRLGSPKPYNSGNLKAPEHFQHSLPPSTAGDESFFRSGCGEGLSEPVMEFPAVLGVLLKNGRPDLQLAPPHTGSFGPFGPENPGRVRKESRKSTLKQGPKSPERVRPGAPKESEKSPKVRF